MKKSSGDGSCSFWLHWLKHCAKDHRLPSATSGQSCRAWLQPDAGDECSSVTLSIEMVFASSWSYVNKTDLWLPWFLASRVEDCSSSGWSGICAARAQVLSKATSENPESVPVCLFVCEKPSDSCRIADSSRNMADLINCVVLGSYASSSVSALNFVSLPLPKDGDNYMSQKRWLKSKLVGWFYAHLKDAEIS